MIKLRGINVYPTAIGGLLADHAAAGGEYVCRVERRGARDEMTVVLEVRPGVARTAELAHELETRLRQKIGVEIGVELVGPGETAALSQIESRQKPIRLVDRRRP